MRRFSPILSRLRELLAIVPVLLLGFAAHAGDQIAFKISCDEPGNRPKQTIRWPVTVGVPFAKGAIDDKSPLWLSDVKGRPMAVETQVIGRWLPDPKTPQWVLLDFQADFNGKTTPWTLRAGGGQTAAQVAPVKIEQTLDRIRVDTGAVSFTVDRRHFSLLDTLELGGADVLKGSSIYWVDEAGRRYETRAHGEPKVEVEQSGPLRAVVKAEGWYAPAGGQAGDPLMRYQVRIAAFAGLPYVRVFHTIIWTVDDSVKVRDWGLSFTLANDATEARVGVEGGPPIRGRLARPMEAVQESYDKKPQLSGWAQAGRGHEGLAVAVTDMNWQLPKSFTISKHGIDVHLWAPQAGLLSMHENDRMSSPNIPTAQREWLVSNKITSPMGVAKTHEIWLWPVGKGTPPSEAINDYIQRPLAPMADVHYQCATEAMPGLRPAADTPGEYRFIEDGLDAIFQTVSAPDPRLKDFDTFNFGSVHLFSPAGWRGYDNNGYNWSQTPWRFFYRTGKRDYMLHGVRNARHVMDVTVCHFAAPGSGMKRVGFAHMYSPLPWGWGPFGDNFHTHPQYLLHYYRMTGYERACDVLDLMADAGRGAVPKPEQYPVVSRSQYGGIHPKAVYYQHTGEQTFRDQALGWARLAMGRRDKEGRFTENTFWYFFHRGLWHTYQITGDKEVLDSLLRLVRDFAKAPADPVTAPFWTRDSMIAFAAAYRATGNEQYLAYPIRRIIDEMSAVQLEGPVAPWEGGRGFTAMARNTVPVFFDCVPELLGAWHDLEFKPMPIWRANNAFLGSRAVDAAGFKSRMLIHVKKAPGKAGQVRLFFQDTNWSQLENLQNKKVEARVSGPGGFQRTIALEVGLLHQPAPILFEAGAPAGVYCIEIAAQAEFFCLVPKTDLPGLVVEIADRRLHYKFRQDPGRIYCRLEPNRTALKLTTIGAPRKGIATPLRVANSRDQTIAHYTVPGPKSLDVPIPAADREQLLVLARGYNDWVPWDMNLPGLLVEGVLPYFAVQPEQWFDPASK